jgi:hypothetical protein
MTNKAPFCTSFWLIRTVFTRPKTSIISVNPVILSNFSSFLCAFCAFLWLKNPFNPWLINDLRSTKDYVRKNNLFMQNKANFQKVKFSVTKVLTKNYDLMDTWSIRKKQSQNKANTNPKQSRNKPNTNPIQTQTNPISEAKTCC